MADEADLANDHTEKELEQRIAAARRKRPFARLTTCMNCGDPIQTGRYCSKDCVEDDEARLRHLRRNGTL